jgi:tetratricopeptide (TPR) repeat protein
MAIVALHLVGSAGGTPHIPERGDEVLVRLPMSLSRSEAAQLRQSREIATGNTNRMPAALALARKLIDFARADGDPRHLSHAQSVLAPWWNLSDAPIDVILLRATIRQSLHDFSGASADLEEVLRRDPQNGQACLTKCVLLTVIADYPRAKQSTFSLLRHVPKLTALTAICNVASLTGEARRSYELLSRTYAECLDSPPAERLWSVTVLAEIAARLGLVSEAEMHCKEALMIAPLDIYARAAYADFLLDHDRAQEAADLLKGETTIDCLLLRLAEAERRIGQTASSSKHRRLLEENFMAAAARHESLHRREEVMFQLRLCDNPSAALKLAILNWQVQREILDARVFLEAALAAKDPAAAAPVLSWFTTNKVEAVRLASLVDVIKALSSPTATKLVFGKDRIP